MRNVTLRYGKHLRVCLAALVAGAIGIASAAERGFGKIAVFSGPACRASVCAALGADGFELEEAAVVRELGRGVDYRGVVFVSDAETHLAPTVFRRAVKVVRDRYPAASAFHVSAPGCDSPLAAECLELFVAEKNLMRSPAGDRQCYFNQVRPFVKSIMERGWGTDQALAGPARKEAQTVRDRRTARLHDAKFGVFTHFLYWGTSPETWRKKVEAFDVKKVADQLQACGAGFYFITVMQGSRWMCAPNATFDRICGTKPGEACSVRDLPMELADELAKRGIDLYLYYTGDGPYKDRECGPKMGYAEPRVKPVGRAFVDKWTSVLEEYAVRYGDKVKGWWIDGCYRMEFFDYTDELLSLYGKAVRKGNPDGLFACNDGVKDYYFKNAPDEDFTCGEFNDFYCVPNGRYVEGAQAFALIPLGTWKGGHPGWMSSGTKRSADYVSNYVDLVNRNGGVVCIDVHFSDDGTIDPDQFAVLKAVGERVRRSKAR